MPNRILFVDDEARVLGGLKRVLHSTHDKWDMHFVQSAQEALAALGQSSFDVVVTDILMPGMDGLALLLALAKSERTRDIPLIVLTGVGERDIKRRALALGATDLLNKPVDPEELVARLSSALRLKARQDELKALNDSLERKVRERTADLELSQQDIIWRLAKVAENRDEQTGYHVLRVACYSEAIAEELGMPRDNIETLFLASSLHDVGKIALPDRILLKPGNLTREERDIMEQHCMIGAAILEQRPKGMKPYLLWRIMRPKAKHVAPPRNLILEMAATIARTHHERWDGSGYPYGLKGEAIPLEGRIVALGDVYDALTSSRPYKPAYSEDKSLTVMRSEVGRHFDPRIYAAFEKQMDLFRTIQSVAAEEETIPA